MFMHTASKQKFWVFRNIFQRIFLLDNIIMIHYQFCIRKVIYCKSNSLFKKTTNCENLKDPKASCERPGETRGVWSSGQYQLWHQTVTTVTQVRVVTRLWPAHYWVWLHWPREQKERESSSGQMTSGNISRVQEINITAHPGPRSSWLCINRAPVMTSGETPPKIYMEKTRPRHSLGVSEAALVERQPRQWNKEIT